MDWKLQFEKTRPHIIKQSKQYFIEDGCYPQFSLFLSSIFAITGDTSLNL